MSAQVFTMYEMGQGQAVQAFMQKHDAIIGSGAELKGV